MTVKRIVFIRPGETDWNRLGRWQGWVSIPLNELGFGRRARWRPSSGISAWVRFIPAI